jgi:hypothetical protein
MNTCISIFIARDRRGQYILRLVLLLPARTRHEASNGMDDPTCFVNLYVKKQKNI